MPWRGPEVPGEFPTLGYVVADWIEARCAIPDGEALGEPFVLTDEMLRFLLNHYRVKPEVEGDRYRPSAAWVHPRGSQLVRPQKWGKGPFSASVVCAEAEGPVLFDGWDAHGEPVGRPWPTPLIQCTAISHDQTANVWRPLVSMIELGSIAADIPDTGDTRINLSGGGRIEPVTSSAKSRLGQPVTFVVQDESHSWTQRNGGRDLADNQRRNLAGMKGRFMETTNAWDPTEESVAQDTNENPSGVYVDFPPSPKGSVRNRRERIRVMRSVYGDSATTPKPPEGEEVPRWRAWVDLDRIDAEIVALLKRDPAQAERFFLNRVHAGESVAFDLDKFKALAKPSLVIPDGELVVLGVDGARYEDALAVIATDVVTGHQWVVKIITRPRDAPDSYEHDFDAVDGAVTEAFERWQVWRAYIDPQRIETLVDKWQGRWTEKRVVEWFTNRPRQICYAVRNYAVAINSAELSNDGDPVFTAHVGQARKYPHNVKDEDGRKMHSIQKDRPGSPSKIDAAMAGVISWEARGDAIAAGAKKRRNVRRKVSAF